MVRQTSLLAFQQIMDNQLRLTDSYKEIINTLKESYGLTDFEMAKRLGYSDPNKIRPRRNELVKKGYIIEVGKRPDRYTKKTSIIWDLRNKKILCEMS